MNISPNSTSPTAQALMRQIREEEQAAKAITDDALAARKDAERKAYADNIARLKEQIAGHLRAYEDHRGPAHDAITQAFRLAAQLPQIVQVNVLPDYLRHVHLPKANDPNATMGTPIWTTTNAELQQQVRVQQKQSWEQAQAEHNAQRAQIGRAIDAAGIV